MQAAFVCVICQPAFAGRALAVAEVVEVLHRNLAHPAHRLIPLDFGFDEALRLCTGGIFGHRKATGAWLLSATIRANVKLLSFDRGVGQLLRSDAERNADVLMLA